MNFKRVYTKEICGKEYEFKLTTYKAQKLEKALDESPLVVLNTMATTNKLPSNEFIFLTMYYALINNKISEQQWGDIIDECIDNEEINSIYDLLEDVLKILAVSGYIDEQALNEAQNNEKN